MIATARARSTFKRHFGEEPAGVVFAPGRVNLIGDHVDYCDGLALPLPLSLGTAIAWRAGSGNQIRAIAANFSDDVDAFSPGEPPEPEHGWRTYLRGMAAIMGNAVGQGAPLDLAIAGDLPRGAGLSSSASLCIALGRALMAGGLAAPLAPVDLARAAQRAEHDYAQVACGIMDQMVSVCGQAGHAMLLDCRDLTWQNLAVPSGWAVLVIPSGVTRGLVDGEYNLRRLQCENAARGLRLSSLRDATPDLLAAADLGQVEHKRAAHVIAEIARVRTAATCMQGGDLAGIGQCLNASHASLRDLFEVSHPDVDRLVALLQHAIGDAGGARMTGGGFGGTVVAVVRAGEADRLRSVIAEEYSPESAAQMLIVDNVDTGRLAECQ